MGFREESAGTHGHSSHTYYNQVAKFHKSSFFGESSIWKSAHTFWGVSNRRSVSEMCITVSKLRQTIPQWRDCIQTTNFIYKIVGTSRLIQIMALLSPVTCGNPRLRQCKFDAGWCGQNMNRKTNENTYNSSCHRGKGIYFRGWRWWWFRNRRSRTQAIAFGRSLPHRNCLHWVKETHNHQRKPRICIYTSWKDVILIHILCIRFRSTAHRTNM